MKAKRGGGSSLLVLQGTRGPVALALIHDARQHACQGYNVVQQRALVVTLATSVLYFSVL